MSGGAFDYFYFNVEEAMLSHVQGIDKVINWMGQHRKELDPRLFDVISDLRTSVVKTQGALHDANLLLYELELEASGDGGELASTLEQYLKKRVS